MATQSPRATETHSCSSDAQLVVRIGEEALRLEGIGAQCPVEAQLYSSS